MQASRAGASPAPTIPFNVTGGTIPFNVTGGTIPFNVTGGGKPRPYA